jgi:hypothetical protein
MRQSRDLATVLQQLGADAYTAGLDLADYVQPTYLLDDLTAALPNRASGVIDFSVIPGVGVGTFSCFELTPTFGMWIRRLTQNAAGNWLWMLFPNTNAVFGLVDGIPDATMNVVAAMPELSPIVSGLLQLHAAINSSTQLRLFTRATSGTALAITPGMVFEVLSGEAFASGPVWCPPGVSLFAISGVVNTGVRFRCTVELPAECFRA